MLMFALLGILPAPSARAESDALSVTGVIHTLDLKAKMLTIKKADNSTVTLRYNKLTVIERNGRTVKAKALALQDAIKARYKANLAAVKFTVTGPKTGKVAGALTNALKGDGTVMIGATLVQTNAQTRISRNGKLVSLSQLTRSDSVVAHTQATTGNVSTSGNEANDILASGPEEDEVHGIITAISGTQVTITPTNGTADVAVNVTDATMIEVDGNHAALGDLAVGMQVEAHYDPTTFDAFAIETDSIGASDDAHVTGTVSAVDLIAGTVTIAPANITLFVDAATEMEVNDSVGTLADLQIAMPIRAEYDMTTLLAKEINAGAGDENGEDAEIEGTVAEVDVINNTLTIAPTGGGADVTVNIVTETDIEVNGVNASLGSVQVTMPVRAEYDTTTMNAFEINAGTDDGGGDCDEDKVNGTIAAVDTTNSTVTITPDGGGADITLLVTDTTEIEVNGEAGTLADFNNGDAIEAKYIAATLEATELKVGDNGGGD
jgi:hypothetical protein